MSKKAFQMIQIRKPQKSNFDLTHEVKTTMNMGELVPVLMQNVLPNDTYSVDTEALVKMHPLIAPVMHRIDASVHYFAVPKRILWDQWEKFITGGKDGTEQPTYPYAGLTSAVIPTQWANGQLADYMGLPTSRPLNGVDPVNIDMLPFRAYQMIYNEWYRDQNLIDEVEFSTGDITDTAEIRRLMTLRKSAYQKDYFTSCLPWRQRGEPSSVAASVEYTDDSIVLEDDGSQPASSPLYVDNEGKLADPGGSDLRIENIDQINIDINDLREATAIQRFLEKMARTGSRYVEYIEAIFGRKTSDSRFQRPEYLGGGRLPVSIGEVLNTSDTANAYQGNRSGIGTSAGMFRGFTYNAEEHMIIIGIMRILPKTAYFQGLNRHWYKFDRFDHAQPDFANLGEQEVKKGEIYLDMNEPASNDVTFGYQEIFAEYKYQEDSVHGDFKDTLGHWVLPRVFDDQPALNQDFIECNEEDLRQIFPVSDTTDKFYCQLLHRVNVNRALPYFANPSLI